MYRDEFNLIVQRDMDGGDTCQRTGMWAFGLYLNSFFEKRLQTLFEGRIELLHACKHLEADGILHRHPGREGSPSFWHDPRELSRDQQDALVIALGACRVDGILLRIWKRHSGRAFKYQNKDLPTLQTFGVWIRAWRAWALWPVLWVSDMGLLLNAFAIWLSARNKPDDSDDVNHIMRLAQAQRFLPTPVSWAARKLYKRIRPPCWGIKGYGTSAMPESFKYNETDRVMATLVWYFRAENGGNPEFAELWRPIVEAF